MLWKRSYVHGSHFIKRFYEDIDLNLQSEKKPSESKRRQLKTNITQIISDLEFELTNADSIRSRRDYNRYIIDDPSSLSAAYLKEQLIVETAIYQRAYPTKVMSADSLIYQYLHENGYDGFIKQYDLEPFELNVQTAERTLLDKMYALADYYLMNTTTEHSRHIYDKKNKDTLCCVVGTACRSSQSLIGDIRRMLRNYKRTERNFRRNIVQINSIQLDEETITVLIVFIVTDRRTSAMMIGIE